MADFNQGHSNYGKPQLRIGGPMTPAVKILLIVNIAVFVLTAIPALTDGGRNATAYLNGYLGMTPAIFWSQFTLWMPFTYMFLHGGIWHVLMNMLTLWMLGGDVENVFGTRQFIIYYLVCGAGAGLLVAILQPGIPIPTIGASGAVYGVLVAFGLFFPNRILNVYGIIPVKAKFLVMIWAAMVFFSAMNSSNDGVSHYAHLGGLVIGFLYIKRRSIMTWLKSARRKNAVKSKVVNMDKVRKLFEEDDDKNHRVH